MVTHEGATGATEDATDATDATGGALDDAPVPQVVIDCLVGPVAFAAGASNVIMQLSLLPVGHGVAESTVESGRADRHPVKRLRTTFSYLAVAVLGTPADRQAMRQEVNRSHRPVRSGPADAVRYNAFDPQLQLWVAACLYRGVEISYRLIYGVPDEATADVLYRHSARLGTTLQVTERMWPADRAAFEDYWQQGLQRIRMDDTTRNYLQGLARLGFMPAPVRSVFGPLHELLSVGFLPEPFRVELGLPWGPNRQRLFDGLTRAGGRVARMLPQPLKAFPFNWFLWDVRRRVRTGRPIV
jgi:uncharacterized protein (DUF2236 family)